MKKIILIFLLYSAVTSFAQISNELIIEQIERMAENSEEENLDYSELIEAYWSLLENPININSNDIDILTEYKIISIFQLENIKNYQQEYGDILIIEELYEIESIDDRTIEMLRPIIIFQKDESSDKIQLRNMFKYGKHKIISEIYQCLNEKDGYKNIEDSLLYKDPNSIYLGSPQRLYFRYDYNYKNRIESGFVLEKDPGEYIFQGNINDSIRKLLGNKCYKAFDFISFHFHLKDFGLVKSLSIGDYKLSFGQGLTMGSGLAFTAKGGSLLRRSRKITASKTANEGLYLRGIAGTFNYKNFELSVFYSNKKRDANIIVYDSLEEKPLKISSLQQSGLHRTYNEILDRRVIRQQLYGCNLSYKTANFQLAYTIHKTDLNAELDPNNYIYNLFYFRGKSLINQGIDFYYVLNKIIFYGELAMSDNKAFAGLVGSTIQAAGYIDLTILYRNYDKRYQCLYSNAFASGSNTRNEKGWYFSSSISIAANWKLITSFDLYQSDWLKNTAHSPSNSHDLNIQLNYQPKKNILFFLEYRHKEKMKNTGKTDIYQRYLINDISNVLRFHSAFDINDCITIKSRAEYNSYNDEDGKSDAYLIYQDIIYNNAHKKYSIAFRYELFNAEKGSVYAHENDVLYAFSVGGLSNKGKRVYIVVKIKPIDKLQISSKIACTFYDNIHEIGSGLEKIEANHKAEAKLQLILTL
ncbi:MAG: hypothetical protein E7066_06760 [Lentimicrobiaceae bacterium]|nr:hypothetical protein [Lentimicrobiaceae bacterium]